MVRNTLIPAILHIQNVISATSENKILYASPIVVTFDTHFIYPSQIYSVITRASSRIDIFKALAGINWNQDKETTLITYKSLIRSFSIHATPIWFLNSSSSMIHKFWALQNSALYVATGNV